MVAEGGETQEEQHLKILAIGCFSIVAGYDEERGDQENVDVIYPRALSRLYLDVGFVGMVAEDYDADG